MPPAPRPYVAAYCSKCPQGVEGPRRGQGTASSGWDAHRAGLRATAKTVLPSEVDSRFEFYSFEVWLLGLRKAARAWRGSGRGLGAGGPAPPRTFSLGLLSTSRPALHLLCLLFRTHLSMDPEAGSPRVLSHMCLAALRWVVCIPSCVTCVRTPPPTHTRF